MDYESLSERQRGILDFIQKWSSEHGYPPTIREIGKAVKINSTSVVNYNLNKLVKEGFISRSKDVSRGIRLTGSDGTDFAHVPWLGQIVAGQPTPVPGDFSEFDEETAVAVPPSLISEKDPTNLFALTVSGHSMIDAMIDDGDTVILRRQEIARNGEMVAVWLNERGETTLKHFFDEGAKVRLQPANPYMDPIYVDKDKVQIQGKVLAVLRKVN